MCNGSWHSIADLLVRLEETRELLVNPNVLADKAALEKALGNLLAVVDWFEHANHLEIDPQRVEAEFDRYEEQFDDATTQRERPFS